MKVVGREEDVKMPNDNWLMAIEPKCPLWAEDSVGSPGFSLQKELKRFQHQQNLICLTSESSLSIYESRDHLLQYSSLPPCLSHPPRLSLSFHIPIHGILHMYIHGLSTYSRIETRLTCLCHSRTAWKMYSISISIPIPTLSRGELHNATSSISEFMKIK